MGTTSALPGFNAPSVGFEQPFAMLEACHERVQRTLALLQRLRAHVLEYGADVPAQQAARDVLRYFDIAAPLQRMVDAIKGGAHGAYIPFDRQGQPVRFG